MHGGDVWRVAEEFGIPAREILDFSANINPRGLPEGAAKTLARDASDARLLSFYPDPSAKRLREALSVRLEVPAEAIVVGPGAEALLGPMLRWLRPARALVPVPAFSEYRRVCQQERVEFAPFSLDREEQFRTPVERFCRSIETERAEVVFLNQPHNPSGAALQAEEVRTIGRAAKARGAVLLADEAFADYAPKVSVARDAAAEKGLIGVRSLTKFYGCPALRVGYAVAHPETIRGIRSLLPMWPVTQPAMDALAEAVEDREYAAASLRENKIAREALAEALSGIGVVVFPSAANYLLLELRADMPTSAELRRRMIAEHRILIRNCDSYEGLAKGRFVRVAVRSASENQRLVDALSDVLRRGERS